MTFQEPTPESLKAMAGWAISKQGNASNTTSLALHKFRDGCEELAENMPPPTVVVSGNAVKTPVTEVRVESRDQVVVSKRSIAHFQQPMVQDGVCVHKFSIRTQRCVYCAKTYIEATGRKPELMS